MTDFVVKSVTIVYGCTSEALEEDYYIVGSQNPSFACDRIDYHMPQGEGDRHYVDIYKNDRIIRIFNPTKIEF